MCGIAGIVNLLPRAPITRHELMPMVDMLAHRGPDGEGFYVDSETGDCGLGHRRLSIIDLERGGQPLANEDKTVWITFNGEIYNFRELRRDLEARGHCFRTRSDTEVIVHLYEEHGADCVKHLRGMFAFGLWDQRRQELFLARDRFGQKPLYYGVNDGRFYFGSECKAIVVVEGFPRHPDTQAILDYLLLQYVPAPRSAFAAIRQLPPAHHLTIHVGRELPEPIRYWSLSATTKFDGTFEDAAERVRDELVRATEMRMIADVPLGAFLSGGIDSTIVVGIMSQLMQSPIKACSIGFEEEGYGELPDAEEAAQAHGVDLDTRIVRASDCLASIDVLSYYYDEPFADASALPTYYVSMLGRRRVTVALTGDGGDELFWGYQRYDRFRLTELLRRLPLFGPLARGLERIGGNVKLPSRFRNLVRFLGMVDRPAAERYLSLVSLFNPDQIRELADLEAVRNERVVLPEWSYLSPFPASPYADGDMIGRNVLHASLTDASVYLPGAINTKVDRASMATSLELRSPFQDHVLAELAFSLPASWKLRRRTGKYILREAHKDLIPPALRHRPKRGFSLPLNRWFRGELRGMLVDTVLSRKALGRGYFREEAIARLIEENNEGREDHGQRLWALLMLELWHRTYVDSMPAPRAPQRSDPRGLRRKEE